MEALVAHLRDALLQVGGSLSVNWPLLLLSCLAATGIKLFADPGRAAAFLARRRGAGVVGATLVGVATPFCSCGTTAVVLGMMASMLPWAPIVAFMVASPLTSPEELFYSAGLFGWPFALTFFGASILLGLAGGALAAFVESRGWFAGQARLRGSGAEATKGGDRGPEAGAARPPMPGLGKVGREFGANALRLLGFFLPFAFIGFLLNGLIPHAWIEGIFGPGRPMGVPLAATLGVPFYLNTEASLPLLRSFMDMGMSPGSTLAFLITGAGTSIGAVAGAFTIARWRVIALVVGTLWLGAMVLGFAYDGVLALA